MEFVLDWIEKIMGENGGYPCSPFPSMFPEEHLVIKWLCAVKDSRGRHIHFRTVIKSDTPFKKMHFYFTSFRQSAPTSPVSVFFPVFFLVYSQMITCRLLALTQRQTGLKIIWQTG